MAKVGNFGKIITFSVSKKKVLTFKQFKQTVSARWAKHERIGRKGKSEFLGSDLRTITLEIEFSAFLGVKPRTQMKRIEKAIEHGTVDYLVIGNQKVGRYRWKITNMSESWNYILSKGEVVQATAQITLEEYV